MTVIDPGEEAEVRDGARLGGGTVVCGSNIVGKNAVVAAGEVVEDDAPDGGEDK